MPEEAGQQQPTSGGGIKGHLKKNWPIYTIAIGGATLFFIMIGNYNRNQQAVDTLGKYQGQVPNSQYDSATADYNMMNLQSALNTQTAVLDNLGKAITSLGSVPSKGGSNTAVQTIFPYPKNTPGMSNNFWVYTTQAGDTAASLANKANWGQWGPSYFENYRNNWAILANVGYQFDNPNTAIPVGTKVSL